MLILLRYWIRRLLAAVDRSLLNIQLLQFLARLRRLCRCENFQVVILALRLRIAVLCGTPLKLIQSLLLLFSFEMFGGLQKMLGRRAVVATCGEFGAVVALGSGPVHSAEHQHLVMVLRHEGLVARRVAH